MSHSAIRSVLLAMLIVGSVGSVGPGTTYGLFTDTYEDSGTLTAADNFNNGNGNSGSVGADAGGPYTVVEDDTVTLYASADGINGNSGSYQWEIVTGPGGDSLSSDRGEQVKYTAPSDVSGDATAEVRLTATDNQDNSDNDTATISIIDRANTGCDAASLTFCSVDINDQDTSYSVPYEVGDPDGEFDRVEVTLERAKNNKQRDTASSTLTAGTLSVKDNGKMNKAYTVRVELYDKSGTVVECRVTKPDDQSDGIDPSVSKC